MSPPVDGSSERPGPPSAAPPTPSRPPAGEPPSSPPGAATGVSATPDPAKPSAGAAGAAPGPAAPGPDAAHGGNGAEDGPGPAEDPLTAARRERDEYLDMVRRVQADFENYKKRTLRQQTDQLERATEGLVAKLLPALDAFDLSRAHLPEAAAETPETKAWLQASGLVDDVLAKEGLERVGTAGEAFDPTVHDAVEHAPADTGTAPAPAAAPAAGSGPVVTDVLRTGYRWKGRVIRPAMVRVRG